MTIKGPRALITAAGLSIALLAIAASSASAVSISPTSADFGRLLIGKTSAPVTFTVTKGSERRVDLWDPSGSIDLLIAFSGSGDFFVGTPCPYFLDAQTPSCTFTAYFRPAFPGPNEGTTLNHLPAARAPLTGIGLLGRKNLYCRKKNGKFISHKKITRYCVNR